jgi:hypothetical protein
VFSTERSTVVAEAGTRRDARTRSAADPDELEPAGAGSRGRRKSAFDVPDIDEAPTRDRDGGELVN